MISSKQRTVLEILELTGPIDEWRLIRLLFLVRQTIPETDRSRSFDFVPYIFGPYSYELVNKLFYLERNNLIKVNRKLVCIIKANASIRDPEPSCISEIIELYERTSDEDLLTKIITDYPEYSIFSKITDKMDYIRDRTGIMTLGYEGYSIDAFMKRLIDEKVQDLIDIRNNPWSMKYGFTRDALISICFDMKIRYRNIPSLGIPSGKRKRVRTKSDTDALFREFQGFLKEQTVRLKSIIDLGKERRIALMCFERDPLLCHRSIVAEALIGLGAKVELK